MSKNKLIKIKVRDTQRIVFEGEIDRISSYNEVGPFDIYPMHANFISIINKVLTLYKNGEKIIDIEIEKAVIKVKKDTVKVFLGIDTINLDTNSLQNTPKTP
jgi:F0F1-type ATP synthase epsilon subunit